MDYQAAAYCAHLPQAQVLRSSSNAPRYLLLSALTCSRLRTLRAYCGPAQREVAASLCAPPATSPSHQKYSSHAASCYTCETRGAAARRPHRALTPACHSAPQAAIARSCSPICPQAPRAEAHTPRAGGAALFLHKQRRALPARRRRRAAQLTCRARSASPSSRSLH